MHASEWQLKQSVDLKTFRGLSSVQEVLEVASRIFSEPPAPVLLPLGTGSACFSTVPSVARTTMESMLAISRELVRIAVQASSCICQSSECARFFQSAFATFCKLLVVLELGCIVLVRGVLLRAIWKSLRGSRTLKSRASCSSSPMVLKVCVLTILISFQTRPAACRR